MTLSPTLIKSVVLFPLNVMGVIPACILWFYGDPGFYQFNYLPTVLGVFLIVVGLYICWTTVSLFTDYGKGTPAPWAPPKILVTIDIYRYVRNPMMIGVWFVLIGEATFFMSLEILMWFFMFFIGSVILVPCWEEVDLEMRFGDSYKEYKSQVPRWIPKRRV